jgi:hypothetical protein
MPRLVVYPNSPAAWEIELKSGANYIGRGFANDFKIEDPSVSGSHCQVVVNGGTVIIKDLGSTNGTLINNARIQEAVLQPGQVLRLGAVEMLYQSDAAAAVTVTEIEPPMAPRIATAAPAFARPSAPTSARTVSVVPEALPRVAPAAHTTAAGPAFCKFHPKSPGRYLCNKCHHHFCDLCVNTRGPKKLCRHCGVECVAVQVRVARPVRKGFYARIPGAFVYPFRGFGLAILILATIVFGGAEYLNTIGIGGPLLWIAIYGLLFLFMQNIIHTTASDENEPLGFPDAGGLFGAAFQLGATVLVGFGPAIGLVVAKFFDVDIPGGAIIAAVILGCLYFPMAFLAVAMKDTVMAANPLVVIPAIVKVPLEYLVTSLLLVGVYGLRQSGDLLSTLAGGISLHTRDMKVLLLALALQAVWSFVSIYLLTVSIRILGLLYISKKERFGWFSR